MSPLTTPYFTSWAFFDACLELNNETIGTTAMEVGAAFRMHPELLRLIELMQASRMSLYNHQGTDDKLVILEDIATGARCRAISPTGYRGEKGEPWYARVLPPAILGSLAHVVFTTPYVVLNAGVPD